MKQSTFVLLFLALTIVTVQAEEGLCRFEPDSCSCRYRASEFGTCWDRISGTPSSGACTSRKCGAGWTCSCPGRTHVCNLRDMTATVLDERTGANTGNCHDETVKRIYKRSLMLGSFYPSLSRKGLLANACNQISIWHNGDLFGEYGNEPEITAANIEQEIERRSVHTLMELKEGDVIGFRFKNASYHCFNSFAKLSVNGSQLNASSPEVGIYYTRKFSENWQSQNFTPNIVADESSAAITDFIPLRTQMFSGGSIAPEMDLWEYDDGSSRDHHTSNFYFRVEL